MQIIYIICTQIHDEVSSIYLELKYKGFFKYAYEAPNQNILTQTKACIAKMSHVVKRQYKA
jgi:hypothetical protein